MFQLALADLLVGIVFGFGIGGKRLLRIWLDADEVKPIFVCALELVTSLYLCVETNTLNKNVYKNNICLANAHH
jgi:hypothetical protein